MLSYLALCTLQARPECSTVPRSFVKMSADGKWVRAGPADVADAVLCERLLCGAGSYVDRADELCRPYQTCTNNEYIALPATPTSDR